MSEQAKQIWSWGFWTLLLIAFVIWVYIAAVGSTFR